MLDSLRSEPNVRNIEIKAYIDNVEDASQIAATITENKIPIKLSQTDTYFNVPRGRLKLREHAKGDRDSELIYYMRSDEPGPRPSDYWIVEVRNPAELKELLSNALGVKAVVKKERTVFLFRNVRIHLDRVEGLGTFLEFEEVLAEGSQPGQDDLIPRLMRDFSVKEKDLIRESYCDLIAGGASASSG
jgi:adenylate cyclase class 2